MIFWTQDWRISSGSRIGALYKTAFEPSYRHLGTLRWSGASEHQSISRRRTIPSKWSLHHTRRVPDERPAAPTNRPGAAGFGSPALTTLAEAECRKARRSPSSLLPPPDRSMIGLAPSGRKVQPAWVAECTTCAEEINSWEGTMAASP